MKNEKENIDLLLERNADEQLADVDWNGLNAAISNRLDEAQQSKTSVRKYSAVFKIAAGVAAAAAVILVAVMIKTEAPTGVQLHDGGFAVVKFIESKGSTSVEIKHAPAKSHVMVNIGGGHREVAKCDVEIIDVNGDRRENDTRAAWIIISRPAPVFADNGVSKDMMGMIYLF